MTEQYATREDSGGEVFLNAVTLFSSREQIRHYLRTKVNDLSFSVEERKRMIQDFNAKEHALTLEIADMMQLLEPEDVRVLLDRYERYEPVS